MRQRPLAVYLIYSVANAFIMSLIFTVDMIYQVRVVGLTPLQLALPLYRWLNDRERES